MGKRLKTRRTRKVPLPCPGVRKLTLILALAIYWHPPQDAAGACIHCGLKFEPTEAGKLASNLGALLKKAGVD